MEKTKSPEEARKLLDKITFDLTRSIVKRDELTNFWYFILIMFAGVGLWGWGIQIRDGLGVTGMRDYVSWGMYIANFVFFVAISLIGFLISSSFTLVKNKMVAPHFACCRASSNCRSSFSGYHYYKRHGTS